MDMQAQMIEILGIGERDLQAAELLLQLVELARQERAVRALGAQPWRHEPDPNSLEARSLGIDASQARAVLGFESRLDAPVAVDWTMDWYRRQADGEDALTLCRAQIESYEGL